MKTHSQQEKRKGTIAPLTAILSSFMIVMVAFAVDTTWITVSHSELQNAADAAALAGAYELIEYHVKSRLPGLSGDEKHTIVAAAKTAAAGRAKSYAAYNGAGGKAGLILRDEDIQFGFLDENNQYTAFDNNSNNDFPNTIRVKLRRDNVKNEPIQLFFGSMAGTPKCNIVATASSTIYTGQVKTFNVVTDGLHLLPMTYDKTWWDDFLTNGQDPSGDSYEASDGTPTLKAYSTNRDTGNFGLLSLDDEHASAKEIRTWILNGLTATELQGLVVSNLLPLDHTYGWDWLGSTGFKASDVMEVNNFVGKKFLMPLYDPYDPDAKSYDAGTGNGANYNYNIVQFVGIKIMPSADANRDVYVQPAAYMDDRLVFVSGTIVPAGTTSGIVTTFVQPKLSR